METGGSSMVGGERPRITLRWPNAKGSDGSQPPMKWYLSLRESASSRSLHRLVRLS